MTYLNKIINNISENKDVLMNYKNRCMRERLNYYNYKDNIVSGSEIQEYHGFYFYMLHYCMLNNKYLNFKNYMLLM